MAIKIGKWYITRNNPREILNILREKQDRIDSAIELIKKDTRWFDSEYASIYGELCDCEGYNANRLEVMVNPSNLLNILQNGDDKDVSDRD